MRTSTLLAGAAGLALVATTAVPAAAVKYGEPDAGEHPYVGLMLAYVWDDANEDEVMTDDELFAGWRCTGTQMDADTFLTAGHCTSGADAVAVWYADDLQDVHSYTTVGYGLQWAMPVSNGQGRGDQADWLKLRAGGELIGYRQFGGGKANDAYVVLTNNANTGGTCFGDSGGPTFIEDETTVVAVTSFGVNSTCAGTSGVYRIDTEDDLAWLSQFVS
jgi:secreted trypsin-like serine protease